MSQHQGCNISSNYCRELIINEADPRPFSTSRARKPQEVKFMEMQWNIGKRFAKFEMEDLGGCNVALN